MKILLISFRFYPYIGGIEVNSELLANEFIKQGNQVKIITSTVEKSDKKFSYDIIRKPNFFQLIKLVFWADIVFENNPTLTYSWPLLFLKKAHVIAINTWVSRIDETMIWIDYVKLWWLKRATKVIAISKAIQQQACKSAIVIGNPYRSDLFYSLNDSNKIYDFCFLGRLVSNKGVDLAIKAISNLVKIEKFNNIRLTIIGDGPELNNLVDLVNSLSLNNHIFFTKSLSGSVLVNVLNEHRFILVPSLWKEPFGNVAIEGMACGCVPIVSDGGGLPDAVGEAGVIFKRGDLDDLIHSMITLLNDNDLEYKLRLKGVEHVQNHMIEKVTNDYLKVFSSALNNQ